MDALEALVADLEEHEIEASDFGPVAREAVDWENAVAERVMEAGMHARDEADAR